MAEQNSTNWITTVVVGALTLVLGTVGVRFWQLPDQITTLSAEIRIVSDRLAGFKEAQDENRERIQYLERRRLWKPDE